MARRADSLCAGGCGKLCWRGSTSLPLGMVICNDCRRQDHSRSEYERGCRCQLCRDAKAADQRKYAASYKAKHGRGLSGNYRSGTDSTRHGNSVPRRARQGVYERDGWVCQLCLLPVDPELDPNHRFAATLDHIECQSWALIPNHEPSNLRLVHRACNSARRDREAV